MGGPVASQEGETDRTHTSALQVTQYRFHVGSDIGQIICMVDAGTERAAVVLSPQATVEDWRRHECRSTEMLLRAVEHRRLLQRGLGWALPQGC